MKYILHPSATRGHANHGWLDTYHTFSFAGYHNPKRMHFGVLRVLNDDTVAPGMGFGTHPHNNMEIISIPLFGDLEHKDSMGNSGVIKQGDVQVMSAGTGIHHSEFNKNKDKEVKFLQIWVFPDKENVTPRYDQVSLDSNVSKNKWQQVVSPNKDDEGAWIYQNAWFNMTQLDEGKSLDYQIHDQGNGIYIFIIDGNIEVGGHDLNRRDGLGLWEIDKINVKAKSNAEVLLMEIPMELS